MKTSDVLQEGEYVLLEEREFWGTRLNFMALCKTLATLTEKAFMEMNFKTNKHFWSGQWRKVCSNPSDKLKIWPLQESEMKKVRLIQIKNQAQVVLRSMK